MEHTDAVTAQVVNDKIEKSECTLRSTSEATGIPYTTLRRMTKGEGKQGFTFGQITRIGKHVGFRASEILAEVERKEGALV